MYSIGLNNSYTNQAMKSQATNKATSVSTSPVQNSAITQNPAFKGEQAPVQTQPQPQTQSPINLKTTLTTKEEQEKYLQLTSVLDKTEKRNLELLLKSGILLNNNSNDKSTTLDNLYKMVTTQRTPGLDPKVVLGETINTIANPFIITQNFGDIPQHYMDGILKNAKPNQRAPQDVINAETIQIPNSSACVSASIEFNLAKQMPAEFARFAEGLTSTRVAVDKTINLKNLTDNALDAVYLLNIFEIPYLMKDFNTAKLTLSPDKNATIRAQIQNSNKDELERSVIDVLMQSTFMNVGSQQSYDSLTDTRGGKFNYDNKGLVEFEKTFTESIVQDKNKISVTYQILDEKGKVTGYTTDFNTMKKQILDSLAMGENIIIGYTYTIKNKDLPVPDPNEKPDEEILSGHEITIIGATKDKNGKLIFICNDTDDNNPNPIAYPEDYILPKIHHAGLPQQVVANDAQVMETWKEGLNAYKEMKKQPQVQPQPVVG